MTSNPKHSYGTLPTVVVSSSEERESAAAGHHNRSQSLFSFGGRGGILSGTGSSGNEEGGIFRPLAKTLSEGADTLSLLTHPSFHLKTAVIMEDDRIETLPAHGIATIPSEVANISKNLIGGGVLSLSSGLAMYMNDPTAWFSVLVWIALLGAVFGYFCLLIGKSCDMSKSSTYRECWERTIGQRGGLFVAIVNTLDPLLGIFANASILSQSLQLLLEGYLDIEMTNIECLLAVTVVALLPLCLMKNLDALAPFSAMGMVAVLTAMGCMAVRYWDGSYLPNGQFYHDIPHHLQPHFGTVSRPWSIDALPFVCMVYTSFDMHYNSPRYYAELKETSVPRFGQVVTYSFGLTSVIYFGIAWIGFLTFGDHADGYILNNYAAEDDLASVARIAIGLCALVSYPLNFIGVRDNCLDMLGLNEDIDSRDSPMRQNVFTVILLSTLTLVACFVTDLGLINSVGGGTTVTLLCFVFPALMFREGIKKFRPEISGTSWEATWVLLLMIVGVVLGLIGVWISILAY